ncbi:nucleotide exchange factor GrpE [Actinokineospora enzanensis]|uniref:nucleotide exchange factor GrpE n=1 Tax=Actinokineospora enzanensis TaxID=155975 RepID=UPI001FE0F6D0|nr:nucleotide exchange factor GrpE [Actinokineospora enzanensis]
MAEPVGRAVLAEPDLPVDRPGTAAEDVVVRALAELSEQVRGHHERAKARERVIDKLHAELERLRVGEQGLLLRPVTIDLQRLRDDLLRQADSLPADLDRDRAANLLRSFALSVEQALERCGSVPVRPEIGEVFSPRVHRAVRTVPAESADQDDTIAEVLADGYLDTTSERVTVPARVHVRRWEPAGTDEAAAGAAGGQSDE